MILLDFIGNWSLLYEITFTVYVLLSTFSYDVMSFYDVYVPKSSTIFRCSLVFAIFRPFLKLNWNCIRIEIKQYCIWRVAGINWGFDGHKYLYNTIQYSYSLIWTQCKQGLYLVYIWCARKSINCQSCRWDCFFLKRQAVIFFVSLLAECQYGWKRFQY
jgi:hypothetical protein